MKKGEDFFIDGEKSFVLDGTFADKIIVACRSSNSESDKDGISLLIVDSNSEGLSITPTKMVDSRNAANIKFDNVKSSAGNLIGEEGKGFEILEKVLDI